MKYHTLVIKLTSSSAWAIEFGDYDLETVKAEMADYRENGWPAKDLKIINTKNSQLAIDAAVAALNAR